MNEMSIRHDVESWAGNVISQWERKMDALGIGETRKLLGSFQQHVYWASMGDLDRITFLFEYYGKFVEWGVGGRVNIDNRDTLIAAGRTKRRKKPWMTPVFFAEVDKLREMLARSMERQVATMIVKKTVEHNRIDDSTMRI